MRKSIIITMIIFALATIMMLMTFNGKGVIGESNKQNAGPSGNVIHSGTHGTVRWEIYENGHLLFKPVSGSSGTFDDMDFSYNAVGHWHPYRDDITGVSMQGVIHGNSSMQFFLYKIKNATSINLSGLETSSVENMIYMLGGLESLIDLDLGTDFDTSNVTGMNSMFIDAKSLRTLDLGSKFNTSQVTNMTSMFSNMHKLESLDLKDKFDTSSVTDMDSMFYELNSLTSIDLGNKFDTRNVEDTARMFYNNRALINLDLGDKFDTSKVTDMSAMIDEMPSLINLNLGSKFDTSEVENLSYMFKGLTNLQVLNLGQLFDTSSVTNMEYIFANSNKLKKIIVPSTFNFSNYGSTKYLVTPNGEEYTNKWIKEDKTAGPYTVDEIYTNPADFEGTWVWQERETVEVNKQVKFEGGYSELPNQIPIKLYKDGTATGNIIVLNKSDIDQNTGLANLDYGEKYKYSDNNETQEINYTIELVNNIDGFIKMNQAHYKYIAGKINITVEKNWVNGSSLVPENVQVQLKRNGANYQVLTVTRASGWSLLVEDLDQTDSNGNDYTYTVEEITSIEGFTDSVNNFVITNTYASPLIDVTDTIIINGGMNAITGYIIVELYKDGQPTGETKSIPIQEFIDNSGSKSVTFEDKDKTDIEGNNYTYDIKVSTDTNLPEGFTIDPQGNLNYTIPTEEITATVNYVNGEVLREDVIVKLMQNGTAEETQTITVDRFNDDIETITFTADKTDEEGNALTNTLNFSDVPRFTKSNVSSNEVTYTFELEYVDISKEIAVDSSVTEEITVTAQLIKDGTPTGDTQDINVGGSNPKPQTVQWTHLPTTDMQGNDLTYDINLDPNSLPNGYVSGPGTNGGIEISYNPKQINKEFTVKFVNGEAKRLPVTVTLKQNGSEYNSVTLNQTQIANDTIPVIFENLPEVDTQGNPYTYTAEYTDITNFDKVITGDTATYTYVIPKRTFTKNTVGENGQVISIVLDLYKDGVKVEGESKTINVGESATWTDLDETDIHGNDYTYDAEVNLEESDLPEGYTIGDDNGNIKVTYTSPKIDITIEKNWVNGSSLIPENMQVQLKRDGVNFRTLTVTKASGWSLLVEDLDKTDSDANEYTYTVEEITNIEGFTNSVNNFVITNTYASPLIDVTDTITVNGGEKALPDTIIVELYKDGQPTGETKEITKQEFIDNNGSKSVTFEEQDKTDIDGNDYTYDIKVSADTNLPDGFTIDPEGNLVYTAPTSDVEATVKYIGGEALREEVLVKLKRAVNGSIEDAAEKTAYVSDFDSNGVATIIFEDMPETNADGETYTYTIETPDIDNFIKNTEGLTSTYSYEEDYINITANIIFNGGANATKPDTINVKIKNGNTVVQEKTANNTDAQVTFEGLPVRDPNNNYEDIEYTLESDEITNFDLVIDNDSKTITYNYVVPTGDISIPVVKEGGEPISVVVELIKDGASTGEKVTVNTGDNAIFTGKPLTDNDGNPINYTIKIDRDDTNLPDGYEIVEGDDGNDKVTYTSPKRDYTEGVSRDGGQPVDIVVVLLKDGEEISGTETTIQSGGSNTWTNLDKTDSNANPYNYDLGISSGTNLPDGYEVASDSDGNYTIVYTSPKQMIEITKNWVDGEDVRPDSITVMIKQNGNDLREVTLTRADNMTTENTWVIEVEVDKTDNNANDYVYSAEEVLVDRFTPEYSQDGLSITNTYSVEKGEIRAQVVFVGGTDRPTITVQLKDEAGTVISEKDATDVNGELVAVFEDITLTNSRGNTINYTVNSKEVPEDYNEHVSGKVIKLTYVSEKIDVDIPVNIPDDYHGDVTVELIKNGEPTGITITKTADEIRANGGKVTFEDVDKTDSNGNDYHYSGDVKTNIPGYEKSEDNDGNTVFTYTGAPKDIVITTSYVGGEALPREDMTVDILANGVVGKTVTVNEVNTVVPNMITYDRAGNLIEYTAKITNKEDLLDKNFEASEIGPKHLKVEYIIPNGSKTFDILWQGLGSTNRPEITVWLTNNGSKTSEKVVLRNGENKATFENLPLTDKSGKEIKYGIDIIPVPDGFIKTISASGNSIVLTKEHSNEQYIPHTGVKENFTVGIILILVILYSRRSLRRASANASVKGATKRSFRK